MYLNKSEKIQVGDTIRLKNGIIAKVVNINEFREPSMKYAIDIEGFDDIVFIGDLNIDTVLYDKKEVQQISEEKIFECLNYVIDRWTDEKDTTGVNYTAKCIKELINLYQKEKEKNKELENQKKNGTLSDGFHTFNDLYYQRCILFATICNLNKNIAWKSKKHSNGKKCFDSDNWFIVGIDTPEGSYTYHYEIKYWNLFSVQELEKGKEWDGHTEKDVTRLFSLISNSISKDKIREKIKELEDKIHVVTYNSSTIEKINEIKNEGALNILQELLEE